MATKKTTTATKKVASKKKISNKVKQYANDRDLAITDIEKTITLPRGACAIIINPNMSIEFIEPDKSAKEDSAAIELHEELGIATTAVLSLPGIGEKIIRVFRDIIEGAIAQDHMGIPVNNDY